MSTIPLFQGDESVEDLCLLIKSLHEEMSTVHRKVDVLLAIKTDNTEALREMVASGPALAVVPFEDEATPIVEPVVEPVTSPRKKQRLPDDVRELGKQARALFKSAAKDEAARAELLKSSNGNETRQSLYHLTCAAQKRQDGMQLLSQYDQARGVIRKAKKTNPNLEVK